MKISIIVPIYNVEKEIERCILSVLNQDYCDIELILVNDCSPDNSFNVAKALITKTAYNGSVHYIEHAANQGLSGARNSGIKAATGDYLFFLDSDDAFTSENSISFLVKCAIEHELPEFVIGNRQYIVSGEVKEIPKQAEFDLKTNAEVYQTYILENIAWSACGRLVGREFIQDHNLLFEEGLYSEDALWTFLAFRKAKRVYITPEVVFNYYERSGSIMSLINDKHVNDLGTIIEVMYKEYLNSPTYNPRLTMLLIERMRRLMLQYIFKFEKRDDLFVHRQLERLKNIDLPLLGTGRLFFMRQNILLRFPTPLIKKYLIFKWVKTL